MKGRGGERPSRPGHAAPARAAAVAPAPSLLAALRTPPVLAGLAMVVISRAVFAWLVPTANEDAYITFRYARHLAEGLGAVFNPGERVMGYTSPLWMSWCALGMAIRPEPLLWTRAAALLADAVTLVTLAALLERHASRASAWCFAAFFGAWPFFSAVSVSGLESSVLLGLMALAGWQVAARSAWAGPTLGALALTRPEGVLCAAVLAVWANRRARIVGAAIAALGFAALALAYGNPVPQSALAKAAVYGTPGPLHGEQWWAWILPFDLGGWPTQGDTVQLWTLRLLLGPGLVAGVAALRRTRALPAALAGLAVWALYILTGASYFFWYLLVPAATVAFLASAGLPRMLRGPWLYVAAGLLVAGAWTYQPGFFRGRAGIESQKFGQAALYLEQNAKRAETVLLEPIGIVGWVNGSLMLRDEVGLVTPWVAERRSRGPGWYSDALARYRPQWLVVRYAFLADPRQFAGRSAPFRDSTEFRRDLSDYRPEFATDERPGPQDLVVLHRIR